MEYLKNLMSSVKYNHRYLYSKIDKIFDNKLCSLQHDITDIFLKNIINDKLYFKKYNLNIVKQD